MADPTPEEQEEMIKQQCPFCRINRKEIPSKDVYADDKIMAVLDINPAAKGHTVVFPKDHHMLLPQIPYETFSHMFRKTAKLCGVVRKAMLAQGMSIFIASGGAAGQQAYHFTMHLIPRDKGDGLFQSGIKKITPEEIMKLKAPLMQHITARVVQAYKQAGKQPPNVKQQANQEEQLMNLLNANPQIRDLIIQDPEKFKSILPQNPQLAQLFDGMNLEELANFLKKKTAGDQR